MKWLLTLGGLMVSITTNATGLNFEYVRGIFGNLEHIEAVVRFDKTEANCLVDTGARFTIVQLPLLSEYKKVGEVVGGGVSGVRRPTDLVQARVMVGDWILEETTIGRTDAGTLPANCVLGNDFFLAREFSIDFTAAKIADETSFPGSLHPLNQFKSEKGGQFGFDLDIQGVRVSALYDTGATSTVFDATFVNEHPESFEFLREFPVQEGSNQTLRAGVYKAKSIRFGNQEDRDIEVYVIDLSYLQTKIPGVQAIMGLSQMTSRKWYFNNRNSTWGIYGL